MCIVTIICPFPKAVKLGLPAGAFRVGGKGVRRPRIQATNARIWRGGAHSRIRDVFVVGYAPKLKRTPFRRVHLESWAGCHCERSSAT
jgi:hypothetical protein